MANLYFRYSSMNSGKSLDLLKVAFNYEERQQKVVILTSMLDTRDGINKISSRIGIERDAYGVKKYENILDLYDYSEYDCVLVDEVQFFTKKQIYQLADIVDTYNIPVICYGLRSDFKLEPFEGSMYLMTIADKIEELKTICFCGRKATVNARIVDKKIVYDGSQVQIGGNESYVSVCRKHFKEGKYHK
jgi:thymidine kinase